MKFSKSSNPVFKENVFYNARAESYEESMTVSGTVNKVALLFFCLLAAASYTWGMYFDQANVYPWMIGGGIVGLVLALVTSFKPKVAQYTAPFYALAEGLLLGGLSAIIEARYGGQGLVMKAVGLTFATLFAMLFAYKAGWIKATERFKSGVIAATGGIMLFYLVSWILSMFGFNMGFHNASLISIGFSLFVVVIAALNLILDFDFIERGAEAGAPKYMEWFGAFGLMVTLIWLYIELLRLLAKIASRD